MPRVAAFRFAARGAVAAFPRPGVETRQIRDVYRRGILPLVLHYRGTEVLHASAVITGRGVLGLCGVSGTGKSTIAYGLGLRGHPLWADDAVAFRAAPRDIEALPLGFSVRLQSPAAQFFGPNLNGDGPVAGAARPDHSPRGARRLAALCVLERRGPGPGDVVEISQFDPVRAFMALLPHAYCLDLRDIERKSGMVHQYLELAGAVPVFHVRFRAGIECLEAVLDAVERRICIA